MKKKLMIFGMIALVMTMTGNVSAKTYKLRYAHMNAASAVTGIQANMLAEPMAP